MNISNLYLNLSGILGYNVENIRYLREGFFYFPYLKKLNLNLNLNISCLGACAENMINLKQIFKSVSRIKEFVLSLELNNLGENPESFRLLGEGLSFLIKIEKFSLNLYYNKNINKDKRNMEFLTYGMKKFIHLKKLVLNLDNMNLGLHEENLKALADCFKIY